MALLKSLENMEEILLNEEALLKSERPQDVVSLNQAKLDALAALERELNLVPASDISRDVSETLRRLRARSMENARALQAINDSLAGLFKKLRWGESLQVGSYDASGEQIQFERTRGRYEKKA